jgi:hypothetical protein
MTSSRILSKTEFDPRWKDIEAVWDLPRDGFLWFPLRDTRVSGVIAFESTAFYAAVGSDRFRDTLATHGVRRVIRVPEFIEQPVEEMDLAAATFMYSGAEAFWFDADGAVLDWIVYLSHEESVTLGGPFLVSRIQEDWPAWSANLWNHIAENYRPLPIAT